MATDSQITPATVEVPLDLLRRLSKSTQDWGLCGGVYAELYEFLESKESITWA